MNWLLPSISLARPVYPGLEKDFEMDLCCWYPFGSGPPITAFASYHFRLSIIFHPMLPGYTAIFLAWSSRMTWVLLNNFPLYIPHLCGLFLASVNWPTASHSRKLFLILDRNLRHFRVLRFTCAFRGAFPAMAPWNAGCAAKTNSKWCILCRQKRSVIV